MRICWEKREEIERLSKKPIDYLEGKIKDCAEKMANALLNNKIQEANSWMEWAKLYAYARKEKLKVEQVKLHVQKRRKKWEKLMGREDVK